MAYLKIGIPFLHSRLVQYFIKKVEILNFWTNRKHRLSYEATKYVQTTGNRISEVKKELQTATREKYAAEARMISTLQAGEFLKSLITIHRATKGIEVGVFTGFSTLCMAEALPSGGKIYALEYYSEYIEFAKKFWIRANVNDKIEPMIGDALETLENLISDSANLETFDFVFIDADKERYVEYYEAAMKLIKPRGIIIIDNVLYREQVYVNKFIDNRTEAIKKMNNLIKRDPRVLHCNMLGVDDGISIVIKN